MGICFSSYSKSNKNNNTFTYNDINENNTENITNNKNVKLLNDNNEIDIIISKPKDVYHHTDSYLKEETNFNENFFDPNNLILNYSNSNNLITINVPAMIGEIEYPIYFKPNSKIEISLSNHKYSWSFLSDCKDNITIDGYEDNFFGKYKIGQLLFRTSSSNEFKQIKHKEKTNLIVDKNGGTLILHANVDYEDEDNNPKGNVQLKIKGGILKDYFECIKICNFKLSNEPELRCKYNNYCEITILRYINMARINPKLFYLNYIKNYDEKNTEQFEKIVAELTSLKELYMCPSLSKSAIDHCLDLGKNGTTGEISTNNFDILKTRIEKYIDPIYIGENTYFGSNNPLIIVRQMILDRNQSMSKKRNNIFNNEYNVIGIAVRTHIKNKYGCVIVFSK